MEKLREKSLLLTGYLQYLIEQELGNKVKILTPLEPHRRGCQLSLSFVDTDLDRLMENFKNNGIFCDSRKPNVIRIAPTPLYNSFTDVLEFVIVLKELLK